MKIKVLIILVLINCSCNFAKKQRETLNTKDIVSSNNCKKSIIFPKSFDLGNQISKNGDDDISFSLNYKRDSFYVSKNIEFCKINLMLKSKDYLSFSFGMGIRNDSLFTSFLYNEKPFVEDIQFFLSFKQDNYPIKLNMIRAFFPRDLMVDSIYYRNNEKVFRIDSFYNMPHSYDSSNYSINKFYISKERGIFRVDVMNESTKEIYSTSNVPD